MNNNENETGTKTKTYTLQEAAKYLGIQLKILFPLLRHLGIIDNENNPYPGHIREGYLVEKRTPFTHPLKGEQHSIRTLVTSEGLDWIEQKIKDSKVKKTA